MKTCTPACREAGLTNAHGHSVKPVGFFHMGLEKKRYQRLMFIMKGIGKIVID
jgi:hypothetical protein